MEGREIGEGDREGVEGRWKRREGKGGRLRRWGVNAYICWIRS